MIMTQWSVCIIKIVGAFSSTSTLIYHNIPIAIVSVLSQLSLPNSITHSLSLFFHLYMCV